MKDNEDKKLEKHMREALSWETEQIVSLTKQKNAAWWVAGVAVVTACACATALFFLAPLKTTVPYLVEVDKATGQAQVIHAFNPKATPYTELNNKYWSSRYVTQRESYFFSQLQGDYDAVYFMSAPPIRKVYQSMYDGSGARDKVLGDRVEEKVEVKSVILEDRDRTGTGLERARVHFEKLRRQANEVQFTSAGHFVASLAYKWEPNRTGRERELITNPLGFTVVQYRVDEEFGGAKQ